MLLWLLGLLELSLQNAMRRSLPQLRALALAAVQRQLLPVVQPLLLEVAVQRLLLEVRLGPTLRLPALRQVASQTAASETMAGLGGSMEESSILIGSRHLRTRVPSRSSSISRRYCGTICSRTLWSHTLSSSVPCRCQGIAATPI